MAISMSFVCAALAIFMFESVIAGDVTWYTPMGCKTGIWNDAECWSPRVVPTLTDDVTIVGPTSIQIPINMTASCRSLSMVNGVAISIQGVLAVGNGTMGVDATSSISLGPAAPIVQTNGTSVSYNGTLVMGPGTTIGGVNADWVFSAGSVINAGGSDAARWFIGGGFDFAPGSLLQLSGVVFLTNSKMRVRGQIVTTLDTTFFGSGAAFLDTTAGSWTLNTTKPTSILAFDINFNAAIGNVTIVNGNIRLVSGIKITSPLNIPGGSFLDIVGGVGVVSLPNISGTGTLITANNATTFQAVHIGDLQLGSAQAVLTAGATVSRSLTLQGGVVVDGEVQAAKVIVQGGVLSGLGSITVSETVSFHSTTDFAGWSLGVPLFCINCVVSTDAAMSVVIVERGQVVVSASATLYVNSFFNITQPNSNPSSPGLLNYGAIIIQNKSNWRMLVVGGTGTTTLRNATVSSYGCTVAQSSLVVSGLSSSFSGNYLGVTLDSVSAKNTNDVVLIQINNSTRQCQPVCSGVKSNFSDSVRVTLTGP